MRSLAKAIVKPGKEMALLESIESGRLGRGSLAGDECVDDMQKARITEDGVVGQSFLNSLKEAASGAVKSASYCKKRPCAPALRQSATLRAKAHRLLVIGK